MRPSSSEILAGIAAALSGQVAPVVQDKWAASVLRSAVQLLGHLATRVEEEAGILREDNADARRTLAAIVPGIAGEPDAAGPLRAAIEQAVAADDASTCDAAALAARNDAYQAAVEGLLRHRECHGRLDGGGTIRDELHAYLARRLAREQHLYFPSFTGPPF